MFTIKQIRMGQADDGMMPENVERHERNGREI